ncbi:MAG: hypothetical protein PHR62_02570 [Paludibacter sp.]|nr:hypothetical protein [Paludibacter sp.]
MEDIKNAVVTEETKETVAKTETAKANVTESDTPEGAYVHTFTKPFVYEDKTYTKMVFDFEKLLGRDFIAVENEMAAIGEYALSPEISTSFLSKLAARAAGVASDVIEHLPAREFGKVKNKSRDFLISTGF